MRKLLAATLATAAVAASLAVMPAAARADTITPAASATLDMDAIHRAYFQMPAGAPAQALAWFEQQVNQYNNGPDLVSVAAQRAWMGGQPVTVVTGYIDRDGVPGLDPSADQVLFRFVQTGAATAAGLPYEFVDGSGVVFYRGVRALPAVDFYRSYYIGLGATAPFISYYTPYARLGWLRGWRASYRLTPGYRTWYRGFIAARPGYAGRIAYLRRTYGTSVGLPRLGFRAGFRAGVSAGYRAGVRTGIHTGVRTGVHAARANFGGHLAVRPGFRASAHVTARPTFHAAPHAPHARPAITRSVTRTVSRGPVTRSVTRTTTLAHGGGSHLHRGR